jgi:hypothetical protein
MRVSVRQTASQGLLALAGGLSLLCASTALAKPHLRGLNPSELSTRTNCAAPAPGHARCASEQLVYKASGAPVRFIPSSVPSAAGGAAPTVAPGSAPAGYGPSELQSAYNLTSLVETQGAGKTIALVDAYNDPNAESDLATYRSQYGLPACTGASGCFRKVNQTGGESSYPEPSRPGNDWSSEVSLDLDMASAICPKCKLLLVEANNNYLTNLAAAAHTAAATVGVVAVSNSYTANEEKVFPELTESKRAEFESDYAQPGVAFTAAVGDVGYEVNFPAVLSTVTAVGGTSLQLSGGLWSQAAWSGTGSGCSKYVAKPAWQLNLGSADAGCAMRTNNDVSADADPNTGAAVYNTYNGNGGWGVFGGTSESSPIVAGFYALSGQEAGAQGAAWDYAHPSFFKDVVGGSNMSGCTNYLCEAIVGYDGPTGLGTPSGVGEGASKGSEAGIKEGGKEGGEGPKGGSEENSSGGGEEKPSGGGGGSTGVTSSTSTATSSTGTATSSPSTSGALIPVLSALSLTRHATIALNRRQPKLFQAGFTFRLSDAASVRVTLAKHVRVRGHMRWKVVTRPFTILARRGNDSGRLRDHQALTPGHYRLTLTPLHGHARSIVFRIG